MDIVIPVSPYIDNFFIFARGIFSPLPRRAFAELRFRYKVQWADGGMLIAFGHAIEIILGYFATPVTLARGLP